MRPLGRLEPPDWTHVDKYPLTATTVPVEPVPVVMGVNWYAEFDSPQRDSQGNYWIARDGKLSSIRGGHAICITPYQKREPQGWWDFYDQGSEGACVGFAVSRMCSIFNRRRFNARWLYKEAQKIDEWPGEGYSGTSVRAGLNILKNKGHQVLINSKKGFKAEETRWAINTYRWALSTEDILGAAGYHGKDFVVLQNSWGRDYPRRVKISAEVLDHLRIENGEFGIATDL